MNSSTKWLLSLGFASLATIPSACSRPADPGGTANYGDDFIGYKNSATERAEQSELAGTNAAQGDQALGYLSEGEVDYAQAPSTGGTTGIDPSEGGAGAPAQTGGFGGGLPTNDLLIVPAMPVTPVVENAFISADEEATSTFSIDVDSGSYTMARAAIENGMRPNPESVRVEEFLNYFHFHYQQPVGNDPLSLYTEWGDCPWNEDRKLLMLGVQGQQISLDELPPLNLVYLLDVSGSMNSALKLPLLKRGFRMLTRMLRPDDRVSIVTYASSDRVILDGVKGSEQDKILLALSNLKAGGSTNGSGGIQRAYEIAQENFIEDGVNRVLLATDGDFNVGLSSEGELVDFIKEKAQSDVFLSVYGYGGGNGDTYRDEVGEQLADNGNGIYFYIDGEEETRRAFGHTVTGSLMAVAKDVKLQVEFNPDHVKGYRLVGYENRVLSNAGFSDDSVDAGEMGAGLSVTALYEIIPADSDEALPTPISGTENPVPTEGEGDEDEFGSPLDADFAQVRMRFKRSGESESEVRRVSVGEDAVLTQPSFKYLFAAGVAEWAQQLRNSQYLPEAREGELVKQIEKALVLDREGAVKEVRDLIRDSHRL